MNLTDEFRKRNRKKIRFVNLFFICGLTVAFLFPHLLESFVRLIIIGNKPTYMEIEIPENIKKDTIHRISPDSVLSAYLLENDKILLLKNKNVIKTNLQDVDSFLNKKDFSVLLIKNKNSDYNMVVTIIDKVGQAEIKRYVLVDYEQEELDSVLRIK